MTFMTIENLDKSLFVCSPQTLTYFPPTDANSTLNVACVTRRGAVLVNTHALKDGP